MWLQQQCEAEQQGRGGSALRGGAPDQHEFRIGRIMHERVKVPREENILDWGIQVMQLHADRKSILEVEFLEEEGTGLGPTLEFFALVAAELQRTDLELWLQDDTTTRPPGTSTCPGPCWWTSSPTPWSPSQSPR